MAAVLASATEIGGFVVTQIPRTPPTQIDRDDGGPAFG